MNKSDKLRLNSFFNKVQNEDEHWYYEDVYFFGNTQSVLNARIVLVKKDIDLARRLDLILSENLNLTSDIYSFEKIRFNFMHNLIEYIFTQNNAKILRQFEFLQFENLIDLESGFRTAYDQVNEIYFHKD